jgi:hypothetical protein
MKRTVKVDKQIFTQAQDRLLEELIREIRVCAGKAGLSKAKTLNLTEELTFGISSILDGSRIMRQNGNLIKPELTFRIEGGVPVGSEAGTWMHELADEAVERVFSKPNITNPHLWMIRVELVDKHPSMASALSFFFDMTKITDSLKDSEVRPSDIARAFAVIPEKGRIPFEAGVFLEADFDPVKTFEQLKKLQFSPKPGVFLEADFETLNTTAQLMKSMIRPGGSSEKPPKKPK